MHTSFRDRADAGRLLAGKLERYADRADVVVLALPRGGVPVADELARAPNAPIDAVAARESRELERRERVFRGDRPAPEVEGRTVLLVDDGIATGATMRAAVAALRQLGARRIVAAVPTAAPSSAATIRAEVDEFVAVITPPEFSSVGQWYDDFPQTSDDEVCAILTEARQRAAPQAAPDAQAHGRRTR
ncbi:MAG: phosphoribosyltransferase [Verrucomicrobia bacterium]|nr:MAG: phosphoribosyltransferase [Verrucomicrobiota bacterium]